MPDIAFLLLLVGVLLPGDSVSLKAGNTTLSIPYPDGYVPITPEMTEPSTIVNFYVTPTTASYVAFVDKEHAKPNLNQEEIESVRVAIAIIDTSYIDAPGTPSTLRIIESDLRKLALDKKQVSDTLNEGIANLKMRDGIEMELSGAELRITAIESNLNSFFFMNVLNCPERDIDCTASAWLIPSGKLLHLEISTQATSRIPMINREARKWANSILKINPPPNSAAVAHQSRVWSNTLFYSLVLILISYRIARFVRRRVT